MIRYEGNVIVSRDTREPIFTIHIGSIYILHGSGKSLTKNDEDPGGLGHV
jgi:hypothetical protein